MATITTRSGKGSPLTNAEVDANFTNLNGDKYESGDDVSVGDITATGDLTLATGTSVAAAGSDQSTATALTKTYSVVTSATASSAEGVKLPTATIGTVYNILNTTSVDVKVYPNTSGTINGASANAAKTLPAGASMTLVGVSTTGWRTLVDTAVFNSDGDQLN